MMFSKRGLKVVRFDLCIIQVLAGIARGLDRKTGKKIKN